MNAQRHINPTSPCSTHNFKKSHQKSIRTVPCIYFDPTILGSVAKVVGSWEKGRKNAESVMKSTTGRYSYRQDMMSILTRHRIGEVFCTVSHRTTTTSPKPLTDKPDHKQTSRKDK